ncbi:MFS transporter [Candidatus Sulfidibacterium hydrothermale]|uniref:MFS transporter n=1 Tax=Candidatus Sulfidibacterium hydrothermale TaxID=2875962 RepID=UPI001F0AA9EE|nr:MFS transporter [Candidatus Sulfidibacterium hydrothermale]UBM61105.1 MFS transporter [Candidatus Sulfidibacterium hydrothermale]
MAKSTYKVYGYRWVILIIFMLISFVIQLQWLAHAAVERPAEVFYKGQFNPDSFFNIDFLAMVYMLVYIVMSIPASYIIDTYGIRKAIGLGAVIAGVSGLLKGFYADSFEMVVIAQIGLAIAQPFVLNAVTAVTVRWFPLRERGLAAGLAILAQYLGIIFAMLVTPAFIGTHPGRPDYGSGFPHMLMTYGWLTFGAAVVTLLLLKEKPPTPPAADDLVRHSFFKGIKHILKQRDMVLMIFVFLVGLGIFNAISSMTDSISANLGVKDSNGLIGGLMLIGGVFGAVIIPALSDKYRMRKRFLVICTVGALPGVLGLSLTGYFIHNPAVVYDIALASAFILGFFIMSAGPVGFQYAAEVSYPAPESISQGLLLWIGQISGLLFVAGMSIKNNAYLNDWMILFCILMPVVIALTLMTKESPMIITEKDKMKGEIGG